MKIKFDPDLAYQKDAVNAALGIFEGQEVRQINFSVPMIKNDLQMDLFKEQSHLGIGNKLELLNDEVLENVRNIQIKQGLKQSENLDSIKSMDFTVEMETGTGKTYVYLRSIFEMNKVYGFTKFIIVVPSIAIKEGVYKSLQITEKHFKQLYDNIQYDFFIYNSQKREQVRSFATSDYIQIMVINIDAFRKSFTDPTKENKANLIHRPDDRMSGYKPIEFIQATNPIVIIDEPQSVDNTPKSKKAISSLNPLCTLRYSATHKEQYNLMYKLDSIDAYDQKLVKQIEVASINVKDGHNKAYIKLVAVNNKQSPVKAKIEFDLMQSGKVKRVSRWARSGDDLYELSKGRTIYEGYIINEIYCAQDKEYINFTSKPEIIKLNHSVGDVDQDQYKRLQIRKTIEEHLEKEIKLNKQGLKVLSLFFIDKVSNYRFYDDDGNPQKGKYARIFEDEYGQLIKKPKFHTLFEEVDIETLPQKVHNGYFAIDKKRDTKGNNLYKESKGKGTTIADGSAYELIMKDKEKLLSFDSKLKFIFSHSALKEGWDNPNVFQICTLNETTSVMKKRQEIGRGLRIAVNQDGERVHGFDVNTLTVMANESYDDFVRQLQKEIEEDEGIKFGILEKHSFANIVTTDENDNSKYLGAKESEKLWQHFLYNNYISQNGKIQDSLRKDLKANKVKLPEEFEKAAAQIDNVLKKIAGKLNIKNADDKEIVNLNKAVYLGEDFKQLWNKIKYKTTFRLDFDVNDLIEKCAQYIKNHLIVGKTKFIYEKDKIKILKSGIEGGDNHYYAQELFENEELTGYLNKNMLESQKSVYKHVIYDSDVEAEFAKSFEQSEDVKVYAKLPGWFKIDTPLGSYNPDWAVLIELDGKEKLYFVVETKGSLFVDMLRPSEQAKIDCGRKHFKALGENIGFTVADKFDSFMDRVV